MLKGFLDLSEEPPTLNVHGSLIVYRDDDVVEVSRLEMDEADPSVLMLEIRVEKGVLPMKGVTRHWDYQERGEHVRGYTHVTVHEIEGESETVEVRGAGS